MLPSEDPVRLARAGIPFDDEAYCIRSQLVSHCKGSKVLLVTFHSVAGELGAHQTARYP